MDFLLTSIGSHGDVHPFVGLGLALRRRGHRVTLLVNEHFEPLVRKAGIDFLPLGSDQEFRQATDNPDLWKGRKGVEGVLSLVSKLIRPQYDAIVSRAIPGETIVVTSSLGLGARIAQDAHGFPTVSVHLSPSIFRSVSNPPRLHGFYAPRWFPRALVRGMYGFADRFVVDPILAPSVNALRGELGLPPVSGIINQWWHSPDLVLGLFPEWFAPIADDWPRQTRLTSFPLWDESDVGNLSADLHDWLNEDNPPLVFTPGSANLHGHAFFDAAVEACVLTNRRGLLLTRHAEQIPGNLPDLIKHVDYAPFSQLLPRVAAIVHHGGIGTCAQGLAAGVRQIITPMAHDQLDNATRLQKLGVAEILPQHKFTGKRLARLVQKMFEDRSYYVRCHWVSEWFHKENALSHTAAMIEQFGKSKLSQQPESLVK